MVLSKARSSVHVQNVRELTKFSFNIGFFIPYLINELTGIFTLIRLQMWKPVFRWFLYVVGFWSSDQSLALRTTLCRLSANDYFIYSKLTNMSRDCLLLPQADNAPRRGDQIR